MEISNEGVDVIMQHEGFVERVYKDPIGLPTAGVGHLMSTKELLMWPVGSKPGKKQIALWLREDLIEAQAGVRDNVKVALEQGAFDALVSFVFNVGVGAFKKSTMLRLLNKGQYELVAKEFGRWTKAGGRELPGLVKRRQAECEAFCKAQGIKSPCVPPRTFTQAFAVRTVKDKEEK